MVYPAVEGAEGMAPALDRLCDEAEQAVLAGHNILILSDRNTNADYVPIPALLATSAVHHHLIRQGLRTSPGWWSRPARRWRCTTSRPWRATVPRPSTPIWPSIPSNRCWTAFADQRETRLR
jgi:hypothetical protein